MAYDIGDRVRWHDWADEPERTGVVLEVDSRYDYYQVLVDRRRVNETQMCMGTPGKMLNGLADPLPDNVVQLDQFRREA